MVDLAKIRKATAPCHKSIESNKLLKSLSGNISLDTYLKILEKFYGYYLPFERSYNWSKSYDFIKGPIPYIPKIPLFHEDFAYFGISPLDIPLCPYYPMPTSAASLLGCLYVLEGSTLGRAMLWPSLSIKLGLILGKGGAFFYCYGEDTKENWKNFCKVITDFEGSLQEEEECIAAAVNTFLDLNKWFCEP